MFLKITFDNEFKKVIFKEEYKEYSNLLSLVKKVTKKEEKDFQLFFTDIENTEIEIKDDLDIDYFLNQESSSKKIREIRVVKRKEEENPAEEMKSDPIDKAPEKSADIDIKPIEEPFELTEQDKPITKEEPMQSNFDVIQIKEGDFNLQEDTIEVKEKVAKPVVIEKKEQPIEIDDKDVELLNEATNNKTNQMEESFHLAIDKISKVRDSISKRGSKFRELSEKLEQRKMEIKKKNEERRKLKEEREKKKKIRNNITHDKISCDVCTVYPIKGRRFNCMVCPDYDLCEKCEASHPHNHPMMRILKPANFNEMLDYKKTFTNMDRPRPQHKLRVPDVLKNPAPKPPAMPKPQHFNQPFNARPGPNVIRPPYSYQGPPLNNRPPYGMPAQSYNPQQFYNHPLPPQPPQMPQMPPNPDFDIAQKRDILNRILGNNVDEDTKLNMINSLRNCNQAEFESRVRTFFESVLPN